MHVLVYVSEVDRGTLSTGNWERGVCSAKLFFWLPFFQGLEVDRVAMSHSECLLSLQPSNKARSTLLWWGGGAVPKILTPLIREQSCKSSWAVLIGVETRSSLLCSSPSLHIGPRRGCAANRVLCIDLRTSIKGTFEVFFLLPLSELRWSGRLRE